MAFALALQSISDLQDVPGNHGRLFLTSTLMTVAFTVLAMGGATTYVLQWLGIELHVHQSSCVRQGAREHSIGLLWEKFACPSCWQPPPAQGELAVCPCLGDLQEQLSPDHDPENMVRSAALPSPVVVSASCWCARDVPSAWFGQCVMMGV